MGASSNVLMIIIATASVLLWVTKSCSNGESKILDECPSDDDCGTGLYYFSCPGSALKDQFKLLNNSLPFNKHAFLTTHNAYAIDEYPSQTGVPRRTFTNQEDGITHQLNYGARALMLDTYDFQGDVWLCHWLNGQCHNFTAFGPAIDTFKEIEAFMAAKPAEIVTLILEDYVHAPNGLTKVFTDAGLMKYWFPLANMPKNGGDWPLVSDMVKNNQRLLVFTSIESKEESEGIAYQWNYMVENKYGDGGMHAGRCPNRAESAAMNDKTKSLVLVNYFPSVPGKLFSSVDNADDLIKMLHTCYGDSGNRWANFVAIDYFRGGTFQAVDTPNGKLLCGCDDVHACMLVQAAITHLQNWRDWNVLKPAAASLHQIDGQQGARNDIINLDNFHWQAFVDAVTFHQEDFTSFAVVFEDPEGGFIKAISIYQKSVKSASVPEAIALHEALLYAKSHFHDEGFIFTYCKHLFLALSSRSLDVSELGLIVKDCLLILESRLDIQVQWIRKNLNGVAHQLAKASIRFSPFTSWEVVPDVIIQFFI